MNTNKNIILTSLFLREFFCSLNSYDQLLKNCKTESSPVLLKLANLKYSENLQIEYDGLFCGCNYKIVVPMWASACKNTTPLLLNETTLKVIEFYYQFGFEPKLIDGNPADFIGTQLEFIAYLCSCISHCDKTNVDSTKYKRAIFDFLQLALIDTVTAVSTAVKKHCSNDDILNIINTLCEFVFNNCEQGIVFSKDFELNCKSYKELIKVAENGQYNSKSIGAEQLVKTGGFNNCGGRCVIHGKVQEGCVLDISTDNSDTYAPIRACVRGRGYRYTYFNTDRLRYPMKRVGKRGEGKFVRITWEEAIDTITKQWVRVKEQYGVSSRFVMYSWGLSAMMRPDNMAKRLLALDGGYLGAFNSYSDAATVYISPYIYGDSNCGNAAEDVLNTNLLILWGHNPAETIFGSQKNYYLTKLKEKGVKIIVIDPRQSDSAITYADEWIGVRPSTDSALCDAMAYVIWKEKLYDKAFMDKYCLGFDSEHMPKGANSTESYEAYLFGKQDGFVKTPQWAEKITGINANTIINLAREYATAKPACIMPGFGLQRTGNGEQTTRSLAMLACLTGNVGKTGGSAAASIWEDAAKIQPFPILENPYKGEIPNFLWSKAIVSGTEFTPKTDRLTNVEKLDSNIKFIFNLAGNALINQHSNINETASILKDDTKCEFILCSDIFMTPSARFADILLPAASGFENDNMTNPWLNGDYIIYNNKMREPFFDCKFEWDWFCKIAENLGFYNAFTDGKKTTDEWIAELYDNMRTKKPILPNLDEIKENGIFRFKKEHPFIAYEKNIKDFENNPFATPSGKIEIFSQALKNFNEPELIPAIPKYTPCAEGPEDDLRKTYPLQLIGWHTKRRCHSIHDNNIMMEEINPQELWIHEIDANERGIKNGDVVHVFNERGIVEIKAKVTNRIVNGVCAMAQGAWYTPNEKGIDTRGCINVLTSTATPSPVCKGNPQHTNLVEVKKI